MRSSGIIAELQECGISKNGFAVIMGKSINDQCRSFFLDSAARTALHFCDGPYFLLHFCSHALRGNIGSGRSASTCDAEHDLVSRLQSGNEACCEVGVL